MTSTRPRPAARFSQWLEALGAVVLLAWAVFAFLGGHWILGIVLGVIGVVVAWVTVREFAGHGLGSTSGPETD